MSLFQPFRFFDPAQIPQNLFWMGAGWGIHYGLKKTTKTQSYQIQQTTNLEKFPMV